MSNTLTQARINIDLTATQDIAKALSDADIILTETVGYGETRYVQTDSMMLQVTRYAEAKEI